jgi:hypothetical protein
MGHWKSGMLRLKVGMLHQELGTLVQKLRAVAMPSVASEMLAQKNHLVFAILLHLVQLILGDDGLVNQMLKIWVISVEKLKLDLIIEILEKHILLLLVGVDVINGVPW